MNNFDLGILQKLAGKKIEKVKKSKIFKPETDITPKHLKLPEVPLPSILTQEMQPIEPVQPLEMGDLTPEELELILQQIK